MNNLREIREKAGISQASLHRRLNWSQARLANYELGLRKPGLDDARRIVAALNSMGAACTLDEAFPPESPNQPKLSAA